MKILPNPYYLKEPGVAGRPRNKSGAGYKPAEGVAEDVAGVALDPIGRASRSFQGDIGHRATAEARGRLPPLTPRFSLSTADFLVYNFQLLFFFGLLSPRFARGRLVYTPRNDAAGAISKFLIPNS